MTGVYPQAEWRPLDGARAQVWPVQFIVHTAVTTASSLFQYFNGPSKGVDAHFYLTPDGNVEQYRSVETQANANGAANRWYDKNDGRFVGAVSIETWDNAQPLTTPWTAAQLDTLADIALWLHNTYRVPLEPCTGPYAPGLGWHSMWPAPNPWSPANHTCPGALRIQQFQTQLMPLIKRKAMQPTMALIPTVADVETYVRLSFQAAGNTDQKGQRYWVSVACSADAPWVKLGEMDRQLGLYK